MDTETAVFGEEPISPNTVDPRFRDEEHEVDDSSPKGHTGNRYHYIKVIQTICIESPLHGQQMVDDIALNGQLPEYNPTADIGYRGHHVMAVNSLGTYPKLTQEQLYDMLPWGTTFHVAIDRRGNVIQCPMGAVPLTKDIWIANDFENNPNLYHFMPEGSEELYRENLLFCPVPPDMTKEELQKNIRELHATYNAMENLKITAIAVAIP
jgi:hypothetical protein